MPGNGTQYRHADEADDGEPELPALNAIDAPQIADFDQSDGRRDDDSGQCRAGQMLQQVWRSHE